jgi:hypothetical protein
LLFSSLAIQEMVARVKEVLEWLALQDTVSKKLHVPLYVVILSFNTRHFILNLQELNYV